MGTNLPELLPPVLMLLFCVNFQFKTSDVREQLFAPDEEEEEMEVSS